MSKSCLDHVYTNCKYRCSQINIVQFGNSDHEMVEYTRFSKEPPSPSRTIRKRSYKDFVLEDYLAQLEKVDWSPVYASCDVDFALFYFTSLMNQVLDAHAPWVTFQIRKKYSPWITKETLELMKKRDNAKEDASKKANSGLDSWKEYKVLRNKINNKIKLEERKYKLMKINDSLEDTSKTWRTAKTFMNWGSDTSTPSQLLIGGHLVSKAASIATEMNCFFLEKVRLIREQINFILNDFSKCRLIMNVKSTKLSLNFVSVAKVKKLLRKLKNSKSLGTDGLDNFSVRVSAEIIAQPLHHVITLSLMQSKFPDSWKCSKVIPLHKKSSRLEKQNYSPVC